jgi:hypothetical protein
MANVMTDVNSCDERGESRRWNLKPSQAWLIKVVVRMLRMLCKGGILPILLSMRTLRDFLSPSLALELTAFTHGSFSLF